MGKYIGFILCLIGGIAILGLSLVSNGLYCSNSNGECSIQSKLLYVNYKIREDVFSVDDIDRVFCETMYYPSRKGKKAYFVLKLVGKKADTEYLLGNFPKMPMCRQASVPIRDFLAGKRQHFEYSSGIGAMNALGILLSGLMFVVAFIVLTSKEEIKTYDWEDEEDNQT